MPLNKLLAIVYSDIFDFPLTLKESGIWRISSKYRGRSSERTQNSVVEKNGYYVLKNRESLIELRKKREKYSSLKEKKAREVTNTLKAIPMIQSVFLTGSVAVGNAKKEADIDLMIIVSPHSLWLTRLIVVTLLKIKKLYRDEKMAGDRVCTNIYLDSNHLKVLEQNLFTAHEVLQAKCLYDRSGVERRWLEDNRWAKKYLPNAYKYSVSSLPDGKAGIQYPVSKIKNNRSIFALCLLPFELIAFCLQYLYMKSKITHERVGWGYAYFHPRDLSSLVLEKYSQKLKKLGLQSKRESHDIMK